MFKKPSLLFGLAFFCVCIGMAEEAVNEATRAGAGQRITVGLGYGAEDSAIGRIGWQRDFSSRWFESRTGYLSGLHEVAFSWWNAKSDDVLGLFYSPVFVYRIGDGTRCVQPYVEAGIGAGFLSQTTIGNRKLSTAFQFEDRIGVGARFGSKKQYDCAARYMHYSNAGIKKPNRGMDVFLVSFSFAY